MSFPEYYFIVRLKGSLAAQGKYLECDPCQYTAMVAMKQFQEVHSYTSYSLIHLNLNLSPVN